MLFKISVYFLLHQIAPTISWDLAMFLTPHLNIGNEMEVKCIVSGDVKYQTMFLYCPVGLPRNTEEICFEDCKRTGDINNKVFHKLTCRHYVNEDIRSFIYSVSNIDESWLPLNNSYFRCRYLDRLTKTSFILQNKKEKILIENIDIIIVTSLLVFSLSINVAFCSWYTLKKKHQKRKNKAIKIELTENAVKKLETPDHRRKCRSLDLPQKRDAQQQPLRRNRSVVMLPFIITSRAMSPSPSISSYNYSFAKEHYPLIGRPYKISDKIDSNYNKLNKIQNNNINASNQNEQVSSFKSAMENKISENLIDDLLEE